jgi:PAS domain S-box-containing protein
MQDEDKSKEQLIADLHELRQRLAESEKDKLERKQADERFRTLTDLAPAGIYFCDPQGACRYVNPRWREMAGLTLEEALGDGWVKGLHPEDRASVMSNWEQMVASEGHWGYEYRFQTPAGKVTWVYGLAAPQRDSLGRIVGYVGINTDITLLRRAEDSLMRSEERFRLLFNGINDAVFVHEGATDGIPGKFIEVNETACIRLGYTRNELLRMRPTDIDAPETIADVPLIMEGLYGTGSAIWEGIHLSKDGRRIPVEINNRLAKLNGREIIISTVRDITERRRAEEALRESNELLSLFMRHSPIYVFIKEVTPTASRVLQASDNFQQMIGIRGSEMIGKTMPELFPPDFAAKITADDWAVVSGGVVLNLEEDLNGRNYTTIKFPIVREGRSLLAGYTIDITERKQMEEALKESVERLDLATRAARLGIWDWDIRQNELIWDDRMYELYGLKKEDFPGAYEAWLAGVHPDDRAKCDEESRQARVGERQYDTEFRVVWPDGNVRTVKAYGQVMRDAEGNPLRMTGINYDITEFKRSEALRREMQLRTEAILAGIADTFYSLDDQWRFTIVNPAAEKAPFGRPAAELLGSVIWELYPDLVGTSIHQYYLNASKNYTLEHYVALSPLNGLWYEVFMQGWKGGVDVYMRDITDRKRAEEELHHKTALLEAQTNSTIDGILVVDKQGRKIFQNKRTIDLWKIPQHIADSDDDEAQLQHVMYATKYPEQFIEKVAYLYNHPNEASRDEIELVDGTVLDRYSAPVLGEDGQHYGRIWTFRDITDHKQAIKAKDEERSFIKTMIDSVPGAFYLLDVEGFYVRWNAYQRDEIVGKPEDQMAGAKAIDTIHPDDREIVGSKIESILRNGSSEVVAGRVLLRGGPEYRWLLMTGRSILIKGKPHLIGIGIDISDQRKYEEEKAQLESQLQQARKMESVGRLAGGVAHDFNNMLSIIIGHAEMVLDEIKPGDAFHHDVMEMKTAAERSADLTRQLLAFARKQTVSPKILDLNETASGILKMLQRLIGEDISLSWIPGLDVWPVKIDPSQIDQVLANLAVNARDAIGGVGIMTIETANVVFDETYCLTHKGFKPGSYVLLAVSDTGAGMDKKTLDLIFEPFFTTKELGKGTGLGLATVYGIVKQNNGFINVYSEPGQGTTFKIYLPRAEDYVEEKLAQARKRDLRGTETILLVEDEESILGLGKDILERRGYVVLAANRPHEALKMAQSHPGPIHLLITDVVMPQMNGKDLRDKLDAIKPGFKSIYMSGYTADVIAHRGVLDEGIDFLQKPFSVKNLAEKVREVLDDG